MAKTYTQFICTSVFAVPGGACVISHSHLERVAKYIHNQQKHHCRKSFQEQYLEFLERHHVAYDQRYIFKPLE